MFLHQWCELQHIKYQFSFNKTFKQVTSKIWYLQFHSDFNIYLISIFDLLRGIQCVFVQFSVYKRDALLTQVFMRHCAYIFCFRDDVLDHIFLMDLMKHSNIIYDVIAVIGDQSYQTIDFFLIIKWRIT